MHYWITLSSLMDFHEKSILTKEHLFSSKPYQVLCQMTGITKSRTTPYHTMGNGITESFNRILISVLGTLAPQQKSNWKAYNGPLIHVINANKLETTGFSPFYQMFGRNQICQLIYYSGWTMVRGLIVCPVMSMYSRYPSYHWYSCL